ncbi:hypothetical protein MY10362_002371 [Beauveria mimosiformis]
MFMIEAHIRGLRNKKVTHIIPDHSSGQQNLVKTSVGDLPRLSQCSPCSQCPHHLAARPVGSVESTRGVAVMNFVRVQDRRCGGGDEDDDAGGVRCADSRQVLRGSSPLKQDRHSAKSHTSSIIIMDLHLHGNKSNNGTGRE